MAWFKVDDTLHSHPKARKAGLAAMGLWALGGAFSSQYATDGWVPDWYVTSILNGKRAANSLVEAGLWTRAVIDGECGYQFHDWEHYQPSKAEIERERAASRERQKRWRESRRNGVTNGESNG